MVLALSPVAGRGASGDGNVFAAPIATACLRPLANVVSGVFVELHLDDQRRISAAGSE
jgi:hypothetical protein